MTPMQAWNLIAGDQVLSRVFPGHNQVVLRVYTALGSTFVRISDCQTGEVTIAYPNDLSRLEPSYPLEVL